MYSDEIELEIELINSTRYKCKGAKFARRTCHNVIDESAPICDVHGRLSKVWTLKLKGIYVSCYICLFTRDSYDNQYYCNKLCSGDIQTTDEYSIGYHFRHKIDGEETVMGHKIEWEDVLFIDPSHHRKSYNGEDIEINGQEISHDTLYDEMHRDVGSDEYILCKDTKDVPHQHLMDEKYGYIVMNENWSDIWVTGNGGNIGISEDFIMNITI